MPRAPAENRKAGLPKHGHDLRVRSSAPVDHWAWLPEVVPRKVTKAPVEHNIHNRDTKPSFYDMIKAALLSHKVHHLRGVPINSIYKQVAREWPVDLDTYRRLTRVALKRAIEQGKIELADGPAVAYRLTAAERPEQGNNATAKTARGKSGSSRASATKRGTTNANGKSKRKAQVESDDESEEAVPRKKATKKASNARKTGDFDTQQPGEGKWIWQYNHAGWHDYDPRAGDEVENTYQIYLKEAATGRVIDVRAVRSGSWEYQIDFRQYTQQNIQHEAHTVRSIRRVWRSL